MFSNKNFEESQQTKTDDIYGVCGQHFLDFFNGFEFRAKKSIRIAIQILQKQHSARNYISAWTKKFLLCFFE
jgi:hypothetical protein